MKYLYFFDQPNEKLPYRETILNIDDLDYVFLKRTDIYIHTKSKASFVISTCCSERDEEGFPIHSEEDLRRVRVLFSDIRYFLNSSCNEFKIDSSYFTFLRIDEYGH